MQKVQEVPGHLALDRIDITRTDPQSVSAYNLFCALNQFVREEVAKTARIQVGHAAHALDFPHSADPRELGDVTNTTLARESAERSAIEAVNFIWKHNLLGDQSSSVISFPEAKLWELTIVARILTLAGIETGAEMCGGVIVDNPNYIPGDIRSQESHGILIDAKPAIIFPNIK